MSYNQYSGPQAQNGQGRSARLAAAEFLAQQCPCEYHDGVLAAAIANENDSATSNYNSSNRGVYGNPQSNNTQQWSNSAASYNAEDNRQNINATQQNELQTNYHLNVTNNNFYVDNRPTTITNQRYDPHTTNNYDQSTNIDASRYTHVDPRQTNTMKVNQDHSRPINSHNHVSQKTQGGYNGGPDQRPQHAQFDYHSSPAPPAPTPAPKPDSEKALRLRKIDKRYKRQPGDPQPPTYPNNPRDDRCQVAACTKMRRVRTIPWSYHGAEPGGKYDVLSNFCRDHTCHSGAYGHTIRGGFCACPRYPEDRQCSCCIKNGVAKYKK